MWLIFLSLFYSNFSHAENLPAKAVELDALVAKVGREPVMLSDLARFRDVDKVLGCIGKRPRDKDLPSDTKELLDFYIDVELMYLEARNKKISITGLLPELVRLIHKKEECKNQWQNLGEKYSKHWKTEGRPREGESFLVRELEKQVLVEKFRKTELSTDGELWRREERVKYPVKIYLE